MSVAAFNQNCTSYGKVQGVITTVQYMYLKISSFTSSTNNNVTIFAIMSSTNPSTKEHPAAVLLSRAHDASTTAQIFRDKITKQPLLLRPSSPDPASNARDARRHVRQQRALSSRRSKKPRPLSAAQKRQLHIYDIPKDKQKYALYKPLYAMWCTYVRQILGLETADGQPKNAHVSPSVAGPMLASADFHGALLTVVRSRCVSRVALTGIVVKDTKFTFDICTEKDGCKKVPKEHSVFRFHLPLLPEHGKDEEKRPLTFELHGSQFETRAPERANKKFKMHIDPDL